MVAQHRHKDTRDLELLVAGLNLLRKDPDRKSRHSRVWQNIERIVLGIIPERVWCPGRSILSHLSTIPAKPSLVEVQKRFRDLSRQFPVHLKLDLVNTSNGERLEGGFSLHKSATDDAFQFGMLELVWDIFVTGSYERLGTCRACGNWFINAGRNKTKKSCSRHCSDQYWNRPTRRQREQQQSAEWKQKRMHARQLKKERAKKVEEINRKTQPFLK